jgi:hypothetical protein
LWAAHGGSTFAGQLPFLVKPPTLEPSHSQLVPEFFWVVKKTSTGECDAAVALSFFSLRPAGLADEEIRDPTFCPVETVQLSAKIDGCN